MKTNRLADGSKVYTEAETRKKMVDLARKLGCETELKMMLADFDFKIAATKNPVEREQLKVEAVKTLELLLSGKPDAIMYNGKIIKF